MKTVFFAPSSIIVGKSCTVAFVVLAFTIDTTTKSRNFAARTDPEDNLVPKFFILVGLAIGAAAIATAYTKLVFINNGLGAAGMGLDAAGIHVKVHKRLSAAGTGQDAAGFLLCSLMQLWFLPW